MELSARSMLTAGIATLGVGAIALAPVHPVPNQLALAPEKAVSTLAVTLASTIDPITPWVDTIKLSLANTQKLLNFYLEQPLPLLTTISKNIGTYIKELPDVSLIASQILGNVQTFFKAPWDAGATNDQGNYIGEYISAAQVTSTVPLGIPISQQFAFNLLPSVLGDAYTTLKPIIDFTANHYSGQVVGLIGPLLAPLVQLTRSFTAIGQYVQDGDVTGAINELINIPANVTNAVLNGAGYLDLTGVVNSISPLPPEVTSIGLNLGGVISPPVPAEGTVDEPTALNGGVAFDSLAASIAYRLPPFGPTVRVDDPGIPVSWMSSVIGLGQFLGDQMLITPPAAAQAKAAAAAQAAPKAVEAAVVEAPAVAVADAKAPAVAEAPAAAVADAKAVADTPAAADTKAPAAAAAAQAGTESPAPAAAAKSPAAVVKSPASKRGRAAASPRVTLRGLAKAAAAARHAG